MDTTNGGGAEEPQRYLGVIISSTFQDLKGHRAALVRAVEGQGLHAVAMENDAALPAGTVVSSSMDKVRAAAAYIGVVSRRYGQVPKCPENPEGLSLTELEFREARRLGRPTLIFIMAPDHPVREADVELDLAARPKLDAFREDVKRASADAPVERVYCEFHDLATFAVAATQSVAELRRHLDIHEDPPSTPAPEAPADGIPAPPDLYAEPPYIGSHAFVGRAAQLATLDDWAAPANPHPVLLFEAIGGTGKSMLTWEWTTRHALATRDDWAGILWYSFYERGAVMADFCRRALAYMTGRPLDDFAQTKQLELSDQLLRQLQARPWLLVLDGIERVLVAYHRSDAAQLLDEKAGGNDEIANRDPRDAIRPDDDDLLRTLAAATPSNILVTSRLVPRVLLNQAAQPIPGVLHERLPGLRPADAEALLRSCGVQGDAATMQRYLQQHCDCHPLVTGVVAGLVTGYLPARGDFDAWAADPDAGGHLDVGALNLVQKRNHILHTALAATPTAGRQLISTLALLSDAIDYETLRALSPHLPLDGDPDAGLRPSDEAAARRLAVTVTDLEKRGLLQYDRQARRYDLHPVVRAVAISSLGSDDRDRLGQRVVDHFSGRPHDSYEEAESLDDLHAPLTVIRTLLCMGRFQEASDVYCGPLADALTHNLEAAAESLALVRPLCAGDWTSVSSRLSAYNRSYIANNAQISLLALGELDSALAALEFALDIDLERRDPAILRVQLSNMSGLCNRQNRLASAQRCLGLAMELAQIIDGPSALFRARLDLYIFLSTIGRIPEADDGWEVLERMGRRWPRWMYLPGEAEAARARLLFMRGLLVADQVGDAERLAVTGRNRATVRDLGTLRGEWLLEQGDVAGAADSLAEAVRLARESSIVEPDAEALLALARVRLGQLPDPVHEAERLARQRRPAHLALGWLWQETGDEARAIEHALAAYRYAWADGEPYVRRHDLERATALLRELGAEPPELPPYDPAADPPFPWEGRVAAVIRELRAQKS
jgi:tetratricopeptide (TPR) repeat protein